MTCKESTEKLLDWIESELSPDQAAEVKAHVAQCPDCAREVEQLRQTLHEIKTPAYNPGEEYFDGFYARVRKHIEAEQPSFSWLAKLRNYLFDSRYWYRPVGVAATVLLAVVATFAVVSGLPWQQQTPQIQVAGIEKTSKAPLPAISLAVNSQIVSTMSLLNEEEVEELQTKIASSLLPNDSIVPSIEANPIMEEPSLADLNDQEITQLAEAVKNYQFEWSI